MRIIFAATQIKRDLVFNYYASNITKPYSLHKEIEQEIIKSVHKFTFNHIGKNFSSNDSDEGGLDEGAITAIINKEGNYSNNPPTVSTSSVSPHSKQSNTNRTSTTHTTTTKETEPTKKSSTKTTTEQTIPTTTKDLSYQDDIPNDYYDSKNKPYDQNNSAPFNDYGAGESNNKLNSENIASSTSSTSSSTNSISSSKPGRIVTSQSTTSTTKAINKWTEIQTELRRINNQTNFQEVNQLLNKIWNVMKLNYSRMSKGRSEEDTKAVLNIMLMALYQIKSRDEANFNSINFFDQVINDPNKILPEGLFETDIVLSKEQAYNLFSKYFSDDNIREKRKIIRDPVYRWPLPLYYYFDGTHSLFFFFFFYYVLALNFIIKLQKYNCLLFLNVLKKNYR
jgi:hypothetical protein